MNRNLCAAVHVFFFFPSLLKSFCSVMLKLRHKGMIRVFVRLPLSVLFHGKHPNDTTLKRLEPEPRPLLKFKIEAETDTEIQPEPVTLTNEALSKNCLLAVSFSSTWECLR